MFVYAVKFREKGEKDYKTVLIHAKDHTELDLKFKQFVEEDLYDVDRRTVSWAGGSVPFSTSDRPVVIYANLDELC